MLSDAMPFLASGSLLVIAVVMLIQAAPDAGSVLREYYLCAVLVLALAVAWSFIEALPL